MRAVFYALVALALAASSRAATLDVCANATRCVHATLAAAAAFSGPGDTLRLLDAVYTAHACTLDEPWGVVLAHALTVRGHGATLEVPASCPIGVAIASDHVTVDALRVRRAAGDGVAPTANFVLLCGGARRYAAYRPRDALDPVDVAPAGVRLDARADAAPDTLDILAAHPGAVNASSAQCNLGSVVLRRVDSVGATLADVLVLGRATPLRADLRIVESTLRSQRVRHVIAASRTALLGELVVHDSELADARAAHVHIDGAVRTANLSLCYWGGTAPRVYAAARVTSRDAAAAPSPIVVEPRYADAARTRHTGSGGLLLQHAPDGRVALVAVAALIAVIVAVSMINVFATRFTRDAPARLAVARRAEWRHW